MSISPSNICDEGDYVLIRARVARVSDEVAMVCIEHTRDGGTETVPFTLVVERASIAAVELGPPPYEIKLTSKPPHDPRARRIVGEDVILSKHVFIAGPVGMWSQLACDSPLLQMRREPNQHYLVVCGRPATHPCHFQEGE